MALDLNPVRAHFLPGASSQLYSVLCSLIVRSKARGFPWRPQILCLVKDTHTALISPKCK